MRNKLAFLALVGLLAAVLPFPGSFAANSPRRLSRKLMTVGPDDFAAVSAVGDAAIAAGKSMKYASKKIAIAKAKESRAIERAEKKVAEEIEDAMRRKEKYADNPIKLARYAARDAKDIAEAVADAKEVKMKAKMKSLKVVTKSMKKVAEINMKYGGQAAMAIGNAALNDVKTFVPFLAPLANQVMPDLVQGFAAGPLGIQNALGGLSSAIGGALLGNLGLDGPDILAGRLADLLPGNLLDSLNDMEIDIPGGVDGLIGNVPPEVLNLMVGFLGGNDAGIGGGPLFPNLFNIPNPFNNNPNPSIFNNGPSLPGIVGDIISVPANAIRAITQGVVGVMTQGAGPISLPLLNLDGLPSAGLPLPLKHLNNLLSVLPKPDLLNVFKMFPKPPLAGLIGKLPFALELKH